MSERTQLSDFVTDGFHEFHDEDGGSHGSFEIFEVTPESEYDGPGDADGEPLSPGWYWWACFPGCLPDGDPSGPFETSREALEDADEWNPEFDGEAS